MFLVQ